MSDAFFARPVINSPYECPTRHWELENGLAAAITAAVGDLVAAAAGESPSWALPHPRRVRRASS